MPKLDPMPTNKEKFSPAALENVLIVYATLTGTTPVVADEVQSFLADETSVAVVEVVDCSLLDITRLEEASAVFMLASTWGEGEQNPLGEDFLMTIAETQPDMSDKEVAYVGLGDRAYDFFANAIHEFEEKFTELGAEKVGTTHKIDGFPDEEVIEELKTWLRGVV